MNKSKISYKLFKRHICKNQCRSSILGIDCPIYHDCKNKNYSYIEIINEPIKNNK